MAAKQLRVLSLVAVPGVVVTFLASDSPFLASQDDGLHFQAQNRQDLTPAAVFSDQSLSPADYFVVGAGQMTEGGVVFAQPNRSVGVEPRVDFRPIDGNPSNGWLFTGDMRVLSGAQALLAQQIKNRFGVEVVSPLGWPGEDQTVANFLWSEAEINLLQSTLDQLPQSFLSHPRSPKQIILLKTGTTGTGLGGGYQERHVTLYLGEGFDPNARTANPEEERLYPTQGVDFQVKVVEEFTHAYTEAHPDLLREWANNTGWRLIGGRWFNLDSKTLLPGHAGDNPVEDLANSFGIYLFNQGSISPERRQFFRERPEHFLKTNNTSKR